MNEKQRWLLKDLDAWQQKQYTRIGRYGPHRVPREPPPVREARRVTAAAAKVLSAWERTKKAPWEKEREAINNRAQNVKRIILFEKTEAALKAVRALK